MRASYSTNNDPSSSSHDTQVPVVDTAGFSDVGNREENEDSFLVARLCRSMDLLGSSPPRWSGKRSELNGFLMAVADGVGGHDGGGVASEVVVDCFADHFLSTMRWPMPQQAPTDESDADSTLRGLASAMERCQEQLAQVAKQRHIDPALGTTATVGYVLWPNLLLAHVGDSRAYLLRDGKLRQLTRDHTVGAQLRAELAGRGSDTEINPRFDHVLENVVSPRMDNLRTEVQQVGLKSGDVVLLCTDGVSGELTDAQLASALGRSGSAEYSSRLLVTAAKSAGATDNMTAVVTKLRPRTSR